MKQALPPSLSASRLVRTLAGLGVAAAAAAETKQPVAERLAQWLGVSDAIALFGVLGASGNGFKAQPDTGNDLGAELEQLRTALNQAIATIDMGKLADQARIELRPLPEAAVEYTADFFPFRRHYAAQQRNMVVAIEALRVKAREALSRRSAQLKQLAALDAGLDQALGLRERDLLATVPLLLEKRFEQLRDAHQQALARSGKEDDPESWMQPGGWLAAFCADMRSLLTAELEVRMQPLVGLIETYTKSSAST